MNNKFLSDYIILFLSAQNELLETILSNKNFNRMNILKDLSKVVTKTISNTYDILYELNNEEKKYTHNKNELEKIRKDILKKDTLKIYDENIKKQVAKNLHYAQTLDSIMLHVLPDIDDDNYVIVSKIIDIYETINDLFE